MHQGISSDLLFDKPLCVGYASGLILTHSSSEMDLNCAVPCAIYLWHHTRWEKAVLLPSALRSS